MNLLKILIPTNAIKKKDIYLKGFTSKARDDTISVYLISISSELPNKTRSDKHNIIHCYCGENPSKAFHKLPNNITLDTKNENIRVKSVVIDNKLIENDKLMLVLYDYDKFRDSQTLSEMGDEFSELQRLVHCDSGIYYSENEQPVVCSRPFWITSSMFLQHTFNYWIVLKWLWMSIKRDRKIAIKQSNLILSIITDLILGYILLNLVAENNKQISSQVMELLEKLINMLYSLLTWLMGAPVGLKLNNAFNKMLGKYFSYHVQLWWLFLDTCSKKFDVILKIYHYIGYLGFTFQIAVISDMICIATFHSYCIYVYAARLFNIQISGLTALLRLFVGRKYNPLRGGIDSCEYTNQELFVGTVAFTILLLLLPTTTMYYFVFTMFRIVSLSVQHILAKIIYIVQTLPLYVTTLWLVKSHKIAGKISVDVQHQKDSAPLIVKVKLLSKSLPELINTFRPPVEVPKRVEWTNLLSNALVGKQIV